MTLETLVENARRTGKESQHVALATAFFPTLGMVTSLCLKCFDVQPVQALKVFRLPKGGECMQCPYTGYDCLVIAR